MKNCIRCGERKPTEDFYTHPQMGDGHLNKCKECCKSDARRHHHERMVDPAWVAHQRERGRQKSKRLGYAAKYRQKRRADASRRAWRKRYPQKARAHGVVSHALRVGRLVRPAQCQDCGGPPPLHGHHEDYSKPLDVAWVCVDCHGKRHRKAA